eukprot:CAMPEP_0197524062 /NCGR_PEP_ID=MMETSP1318-20131121/8821_1 /TAXON_ID=552666 /ORGANISM="Partenskyella glossopodia, Strain RCC365" /LENGTH=320 /DNA_ID=CAMNT_0043076919 /DNA_START=30 /DNA_END=993 /DNA_ORIENTATION=+
MKVANILEMPPENQLITLRQFGHKVYRTLHSSNVEFSTVALGEHEDMFESMQRSLSIVDVFLGGACNPTTWRKDIAMPFFNDKKITYYNPQVEVWDPKLIVLEGIVKACSRILLFVLSGQTRAISSMVEVTEYIQHGRDVVLVIQDMIKGVEIHGETVNTWELKDLNKARLRLRRMARSFKVPVFNTVGDACRHIANRLDRTKYNPKQAKALMESKRMKEALKTSWNKYPKDIEGLMTFRGVCQMMNDVHSHIEPIIRGGLMKPRLVDIQHIAEECGWTYTRFGRLRKDMMDDPKGSFATAMCRSPDYKQFCDLLNVLRG